MLCTTIMYLSGSHYTKEQEEHLIGNCLANIEYQSNSDGVRSITGNVKNFGVKIYPTKGMSFYGSFVKLVNETNIISLEKSEVKRAILELKNITGLPIQTAKVCRIDIAMNLFLERPYKEYLSFFEETHGYLKGQNKYRGIKYSKGNHDFVIYDKLSELRKQAPEVFSIVKKFIDDKGELGIMRLELRINQNLRRQFLPNSREFKVVHLLSKQVEHKLIAYWYKHYKAITKAKSSKLPTNVSGYSEIRDVMAAKQIQQEGLASILTSVDEMGRLNHWSASKKSKTKAELKKLHDRQISATISPYIEELDQKVYSNKEMYKWMMDWGYKL